ncbi:MAG: hypothetical protein BGP16_05420 [Sphingobium sp. 66-54]|mgnify:CR=1 FL=1|nr:MAG: hypothetical protein BGP16_05420 [Sphingobium sp. 66-54]
MLAEADSDRRARVDAIIAERQRSKIFNWEAVRSGAFMTVTGVDDQGKAVRLTRVSRIVLDPHGDVTDCVFAVCDTVPVTSRLLMIGRRPL